MQQVIAVFICRATPWATDIDEAGFGKPDRLLRVHVFAHQRPIYFRIIIQIGGSGVAVLVHDVEVVIVLPRIRIFDAFLQVFFEEAAGGRRNAWRFKVVRVQITFDVCKT